MRPLSTLCPVLVACALACSSSTSDPDINVAGRWQASLLTTAVNTAGYSCSGSFTLDLTQSGSSLAGQYARTGTCTTPHDRIDDSASGALTNGRASGSSVTFDAADCAVAATVRGDGQAMTGTIQCSRQGGVDLAFSGSWAATRL